MVRSREIQKRFSNSPRSRSKQQARRKDSLCFKSFEYHQECDADIFIVIRLKQNGQIQSVTPTTNSAELEHLHQPPRSVLLEIALRPA
ncbi:hypothetical protein BDW72DRAFT_185085 [Aspergillus terricola var. indicus]